MNVNIEVRDLNTLSLANRTAYDYMRSVLMGLPVDLRDEAADAGLRKAAFEERRHILRAAKTGETAFKDSPESRVRRVVRDHGEHVHLRKTIRVVKLKGGHGYATVVGRKGARQGRLVNYGHGDVRPHEFATSHVGKIDSQLIAAFTGQVERLTDPTVDRTIRRARSNPQRYRTLQGRG